MQLQRLTIKNFRCFESLELNFGNAIIFIEGLNGSGKTSIIEALHYLCYLRSFRTSSSSDLLQFDTQTFFVKAEIKNNDIIDEYHSIQVGFKGKKKIVRVNQKAVNSYKDLMHFYRVITVTEDDLELIKGSPEARRNFIDHVIILYSPDFAQSVRRLKHIVEQRNAIIMQGKKDATEFAIWTQQLWQVSQHIKQLRKETLVQLEQEIGVLTQAYFPDIAIQFHYTSKSNQDAYEQFFTENSSLFAQEERLGRSLFGAHLDDFSVTFQQKKSKIYASRGQQKLVIMLVKIAQMKWLCQRKGPAIFLLDDFMTDFDRQKGIQLLKPLLDMSNQIIITAPGTNQWLAQELHSYGCTYINLTE
ncbi:MAG: DNA replication/repair protein RecF [Candidatus Dependentiae bacterium]